ncbi:MAG: SusD/RagB family nutrient-binding outer membrane lipoprotein [Imperialibacter sp.]|uniref:SusD/RagB family nutrient-binding outer membrane lipoprotein n=1 Tax=Imperialibacter sp. TaxID=2038411 RepID=UPI0032EF2224
MKTIKTYIFLFTAFFLLGSCDKDFVEINTNPYAINEVEPGLLFANSQRLAHIGGWAGEHTIVQHFVNAYNSGATLGFNFNADIDGISNPQWDASYPDALKNLGQAVVLLGEDGAQSNLLSMIRIWKAQIFMGLVDHYGDVPYFNAGKAVTDGIFYPEYDDDAAIYDDLYTEITAALAALNPSGDFVSADLFYGTNGSVPSGDAATQVAKWKKLGNSLLLRLGMRYSKVNASLAESIVSEAVAGGVMTANADNAYLTYDGSLYSNGGNASLRNFSYFNYAAEPLVDQLKSTNDPRGKFIVASYDEPAAITDGVPDTVLANQFGVPVGVLSGTIAADIAMATYRGPKGGGLNYSQMNIYSVASPVAPRVFVTYAQTSLLLAEAAAMGWISGSAQDFYEDGIAADMQWYSQYPNSEVTASEIATYLSQPGVAFDAANALELINTQYWVVNISNGSEAFANFRRSGFPTLSRNDFDDSLLANGGDGFVRRMSYPDRESSANETNYSAAAAAMGGDVLTSRVFWDKP